MVCKGKWVKQLCSKAGWLSSSRSDDDELMTYDMMMMNLLGFSVMMRLGPIECESSRFFAIFDISSCRMRLTRVAKVLRSPITSEGFAPEIFLVRPLQNPPPTHNKEQKKHRRLV